MPLMSNHHHWRLADNGFVTIARSQEKRVIRSLSRHYTYSLPRNIIVREVLLILNLLKFRWWKSLSCETTDCPSSHARRTWRHGIWYIVSRPPLRKKKKKKTSANLSTVTLWAWEYLLYLLNRTRNTKLTIYLLSSRYFLYFY